MWNPNKYNKFDYLLEENKQMKKSTLINLSKLGCYFITDTTGREVTTERLENHYKNEIISCKEFDSYRKNIVIY